MMRIAAVQKVTLLDYPGKLACTVFLSGCNMRCPFCHNPALVLPEQIQPSSFTQEELLSFLDKRRGKLDGVCITGGEPTLNPDLPDLIRLIRNKCFLVKLDTNGTNPRMLENLISDGLLDYVAMDIKNSPQKYRQTCGGIDVLHQVRESALLLMNGSVDYEFRTTVSKTLHTEEDLHQIGQWLHGAKRYFLQSFVDTGNLVGKGIIPLSKSEIEVLRRAVCRDIPNTQVRGI